MIHLTVQETICPVFKRSGKNVLHEYMVTYKCCNAYGTCKIKRYRFP